MEQSSRISLLDLSTQFSFEIDETLKKQICFGEALIMSCGHTEGQFEEELLESDSDFCDETESEASVEVKDAPTMEIKDKVEEESKPDDESEDDNDFQFYFFPDCNKPVPPQGSKDSVIIVSGLPKLNPLSQKQDICTCAVDQTGQCTCFAKFPCRCGATVLKECTCTDLKEICICHRGKPTPTCECKPGDLCLCYPGVAGDRMEPTCVCKEVVKPCVCYPDKFPAPVCACKEKPTFIDKTVLPSEGSEQQDESKTEGEGESETVSGTAKPETKEEKPEQPCVCQKPDPPPRCLCLKGKPCICKKTCCVCGVRKTCVCQPEEDEDIICRSAASISICSCPEIRDCTCGGKPNQCKCFPVKVCTCGDPEDCKCFGTCDCTKPCICETMQKQMTECTCSDTICGRGGRRLPQLKRVRAGKEGYRWCHTVDPRHTFFDYGYGRHKKISYKEQEKEKFKILGLYDEADEEESNLSDHEYKAPRYEKKPRKPSIDCCSAVGGISISVETLGEDQDKFLVQVVSHCSKEGAKTSSKLISILDTNLHTMEENRIEHIKKKDLSKERRSYMAICENGYYNKVTRICKDHNVVKRFYHDFEDAKNFLLEGANVVLLRYFGLSRYRGNVKTATVLMDGTICESIYVCHGVSQAIVNGKPLFICKVERHVIEPTGYIHQTMTVLTLRGYIVSHEWADNNYILHLNPLLEIVPEKDEIERHEPLRDKWRNDIQLLSDYLDFKSARTSEGGRFVTENGTLTRSIRDYLQTLLLLRPSDVIHYTQHYFSAALSALDLPYNEYFDPSSKHVRYYFFEA